MIADLGKVYFLESPGLGLKWHPCSAPQFLAADAALHLKREHDIRYEDVAKMEVSIPPLRYARHYAPEVKTGLRGKFAINYVVAMCILDGNSSWRRLPTSASINRKFKKRLAKFR